MQNFRLVRPLFLVTLFVLACSDQSDAPGSGAPESTVPSSSTAISQATEVAPEATATGSPVAAGTAIAHRPGSTNAVNVAPEPAPPTDTSILTDVRVGAHPELGGWDRIVFEFEATLPPGQVRYVESIAACGSGEAVDLAGGAVLAVLFTGAQAHDEGGILTLDSTELIGPGFAILESRQFCDFEGQVAWAVGVVSVKEFTVVTLTNPPRVVIDIKQ